MFFGRLNLSDSLCFAARTGLLSGFSGEKFCFGRLSLSHSFKWASGLMEDIACGSCFALVLGGG